MKVERRKRQRIYGWGRGLVPFRSSPASTGSTGCSRPSFLSVLILSGVCLFFCVEWRNDPPTSPSFSPPLRQAKTTTKNNRKIQDSAVDVAQRQRDALPSPSMTESTAGNVKQLNTQAIEQPTGHNSSGSAAAAYPIAATGAFVHVGKTGGSTLSVLLRHGCHSFMPHPCRSADDIPHESRASQLIGSYYHVPDFGRLSQTATNHSFYVFTCRDPLDRLVSAFVYDHILNRYARNETVDPFKVQKYNDAYSCFSTLQAFVDHLGDMPHQFRYPHKQNWVDASSCTDLAKAAIHSRVKIYNHLYFSYTTILSLIPNIHVQTLYVVRQEHLWPDWVRLNVALGQSEESIYIPQEDVVEGTNSGTSSSASRQSHMLRNVTLMEATHRMPVTRDLDERGTAALCNALRGEYRAYLWLLHRARNLSPQNVQESIAAAAKKCPSLNIYDIVKKVSS